MEYSVALKELKEIIMKIENEEITVDELEIKLKRSKELLEFCKKKLRSTENLIDEIIEKE